MRRRSAHLMALFGLAVFPGNNYLAANSLGSFYGTSNLTLYQVDPATGNELDQQSLGSPVVLALTSNSSSGFLTGTIGVGLYQYSSQHGQRDR